MPKDEAAGFGDNSIAAEALKKFVERLESLTEEAQAIKDDESEVYREVKAEGLDPKTVRKVLKLRKTERELREAEAAMLEAYCKALGM
jgi:uncharacterized protein (UPF0335 family)